MKQIIITVTLLLLQSYTFGQSLKGKVINTEKESISDVQILDLATKHHTHSNKKGEFVLEDINVGDTLKVSHIGYEINNTIINSLSSPIIIILKEKSISLKEVVLSPKINALNLITAIDIELNPVNSSQDILRKVPGLFIGQHAGGGKAEQIFLRGFDIDHGTDISINVDGLPVNMVSHAHGQGYSDLHFVISETLNVIDFDKGAYYADQGNFNTAGYVNFKTKRNVTNNLIKMELGKFGTSRLLGMFKLLDNDKNDSYIAMEQLANDGFFESSQNFNRTNIFGKYTGNVSNEDKVGLTVSHFSSKWDASGQIPQRAVGNGLITRFGAIDDTEGGYTNRTNVLVNYDKYIDEQSVIKNSLYYSRYNFELYSNFTFFLEDPVNGDQIKQKENRNIFGLNSEYSKLFSINNVDGNWQAGITLRNDQSFNNELSHTVNRSETLEEIQLGNIHETNLGVYFKAIFNLGKWAVNPGLRFDSFNFQYNDALLPNYKTQTSSKRIISPKLNVLYNYSDNLQIYLKSGKGFHSNDTRVVVTQAGRKTLPAAYGFDSGFIWKPTQQLLINTAYWYLFLEQEFVYVGDAGIVEPSGKTRRQGLDFSLRYQPIDWLYWNLDTNYTYARATEEEVGEDYIPLAPDFILASGLNIKHEFGIYGGANLRFIKDRPANEDNSIIAEGYSVIDFNMGYNWKKLSFQLQVQNLLNTKWNETQFATESRLQNETIPVEEIHFTPGTPFFIKGIIEYKF
ncbi:TonB-dependent receptor [Flavivirga jejuensis]|uniref:TonB-dependent receptor plug domain-containing protein n=1 Tax=Flavivirga jejuensis TaxID=870487 RepID=A0ABT8WRZ7_9FLAO|nr:TonB-dependent receptor plug domain-containing protein [Flavivirga jejuensis]MDO5975930.1 TonB-dependent receptor plug domain-containing protein [Flavivirga jejuensis]